MIGKSVLGLFPHIPFVNSDSVASAQLTELILKRHPSMVLFLVRNVPLDLRYPRWTYGEYSVAGLPLEPEELGPDLRDPLRRLRLGLLDHVCNGPLAREQAQDRNVVVEATDKNRLEIDAF